MSMPLVHRMVLSSSSVSLFIAENFGHFKCHDKVISLPLHTDGKEQLRSVLSPYQKGASEASKF